MTRQPMNSRRRAQRARGQVTGSLMLLSGAGTVFGVLGPTWGPAVGLVLVGAALLLLGGGIFNLVRSRRA